MGLRKVPRTKDITSVQPLSETEVLVSVCGPVALLGDMRSLKVLWCHGIRDLATLSAG